jgi:hypothetical protein
MYRLYINNLSSPTIQGSLSYRLPAGDRVSLARMCLFALLQSTLNTDAARVRRWGRRRVLPPPSWARRGSPAAVAAAGIIWTVARQVFFDQVSNAAEYRVQSSGALVSGTLWCD